MDFDFGLMLFFGWVICLCTLEHSSVCWTSYWLRTIHLPVFSKLEKKKEKLKIFLTVGNILVLEKNEKHIPSGAVACMRLTSKMVKIRHEILICFLHFFSC